MSKPWPRAIAIAVALAASGPLGYVYAQPAAQQQVLEFNLPADSLGVTLNAIASQSGQVVSLEPVLVKGKQAPAIRGSMTAIQAMQRALEGSGLELRTTESGNFSVQPASAGDGSLELGATSVNADLQGATTEGSGSYAARAVTIGKGTHTLKEIPQSVTVITRQQLDDQDITDLRDAVNHTTGLVGATGIGPGMVISSRGFQIDDWQYDGVPVPRNFYVLGNWATQDLVFFDRVEILRGAAGLLQGAGSPGGAINLVRKRGQMAPTVSLTGKAGSWDRYGLQADAGGPLNDSGSIRGRMVVDQDDSHSFTDYAWSKTTSLYGSLDVDLSPDTTLGIGMSNSDLDSRPMVRGLPRYPDGSDIGFSRSTYSGASWNRNDIEQTTVYLDLEHRFDDNWRVKASALRMNEHNDSVHQRMHGDVAADGSGLNFADWITNFESKKLGLDMYLNGTFEALSLEQEITVGGNYSKYTSNDFYARRFVAGGNIFDIDHHRPEPTLADILASPGGRATNAAYDVRQKGLYGSWRVKLAEPLTAVIGGRVSWYDYAYMLPDDDYKDSMSETGEVTPYVGLVYDLTREWAVYASYTDVFEPQSGRTAQQQMLEPVIGSNYEVGLKGELLDGRVNTSLALFRYDQKNRAVTDEASGYACDGWYCSTTSGKVRSQGLEAEISGEVLTDLQLFAGYTYNTTKFIDDPENEGSIYSQWTPKHMLRMWADYQLPGDWNRVSVGGGFTSQSHTVSFDREFDVPGFTVWSARLGYELTPEIDLALNANNLFDKRYYLPGFAAVDGSNNFGDPRNLMFSVKYTPEF
ncbi:TonB-dependent siderophore receptor [Pseudomonas sp. PDM14]|uniref:TonB-dependent siderophore receptor n=1 Tax=Pseudomonas sp. PDM14 TaxID=2769288 RepID=UPI00177C5DD4|nr:TonB-dependent siderophore receptor [Pseudomonas sp. PDM14]MBD9483351.1 TonB-dependent siderophore receptor [Pseudomonas sp. PDM14]